MVKVNVYEAKTRFSSYLARVERGETILVCRRNVPVAELRPIRVERSEERPVGLAEGMLEIPDSFFEPLPDDLLDAFAGNGS